MVQLRSLLVSVLALPLVTSSPIEERAINCKDPKAKAFVSAARSLAGSLIDPFCTSFLHYKTKTKTVTKSYTWEEGFAVEVTKGTITYITDATTTVPTTWFVTRTVDVFPNVKKREAAPEPAPAQVTRRAELPRAALPQKLKADSKGSVLGFASSVVSDACSCLVKKPTTTTTTAYEFKTTTITYTVTIPKKTAWTTTTWTRLDASIISIVKTRTYANPTTCGDAAHPTFFVQMRDADPTSKDQYHNNYLAMIYSDRHGLPGEAQALPDALKKRAVLLTIEPGTNYLKTVPEGLYLNNDYFNSFALLYFTPKAEIDKRSYLYHICKIMPRGTEKELVCEVPQSPQASWNMKYFQTCPEYTEYYESPLVVGDEVSRTAPDCFQKRFYLVDACAT
ncbi:Fc.00g068810.m01.CDS01 [Cosmosporella sp. VM-42]